MLRLISRQKEPSLRIMLLLTAIALLLSYSSTGYAQATTPEDAALSIVSKRTGIPVDQLVIDSQAATSYPLTGQQPTAFKIRALRGDEVYGVLVDDAGAELSPDAVVAQELAAFKARYGTIDPQLHTLLASTPASQALPVVLWLKEPEYTPVDRPALGSPEAEQFERDPAAQESFYKLVNDRRAAAVRSTTAPVVERLNSMGREALADELSPAIASTLTPDEIKRISTWPEIDLIFSDTINESDLNVARVTVGANVVNGVGITGAGTRVGQIEVGGRVATANPYLTGVTQNTTYVCSTASSHSTGVAGIIASTHSSSRGIAPNTRVWAGGSCGGVGSQLQNRSSAAITWGARALNLSWGSNSGLALTSNDRFYDDRVINQYVTVVKSAGNQASPCPNGSGNVTSPGLAYNIITVGNFDDRNTTSWTDDVMGPCSSWRDPSSSHRDREKPEVAAPGTNISSTTTGSPWIGAIGSGTSFAAPMVTGGAALLFQRRALLTVWPESVKAILMATAVHNIEGATRQSEYDGAGGIALDRADTVADTSNTSNGNWGTYTYNCSAPSLVTLTSTMSLVAGRRTRAVIAWDTPTTYAAYNIQPSADLDLRILSPSGGYVTGSLSWDNTHEIVEFTPTVSGNHRIQVHKYRCSANPRWLGWAWYQGN